MEDNPKISLVIPAFNEAAYLPRLLDTVDVARNRYRCGASLIEVVVADNASTDETPQIAAHLIALHAVSTRMKLVPTSEVL